MTQNEPAELAARPAASAAPGTTGDRQVDAALAKLADLDELPLNEHPAVFGQIHGALTGALGTLDSGTADSGSVDSGTVDSGTVDSGTGGPGSGDGGPGSGDGGPGSGDGGLGGPGSGR